MTFDGRKPKFKRCSSIIIDFNLSSSRLVTASTNLIELKFVRVCALWLVLRMAFILDSFNGLFKLLFGCDLPDHEFLKHNQEETSEKVVGNDKTSWKSQ